MSWTLHYFLFNIFLKKKFFASVWKVDNTSTRFRAERPLFERCAQLLLASRFPASFERWQRCDAFVKLCYNYSRHILMNKKKIYLPIQIIDAKGHVESIWPQMFCEQVLNRDCWLSRTVGHLRQLSSVPRYSI